MLHIKKINEKDIDKEYEFLFTLESENGFNNSYYNVSYDDFVNIYFPKRMNASKGIDVDPKFVPDTYFFLWDDNQIVGLFKVRHYLTDEIRNSVGHIGFAIGKAYRRKKYATKGLALVLKATKDLIKEDEVLISCDKTNKASLQTQLNNKAVIYREDESHYYTKIKKDDIK